MEKQRVFVLRADIERSGMGYSMQNLENVTTRSNYFFLLSFVCSFSRLFVCIYSFVPCAFDLNGNICNVRQYKLHTTISL